jgi:hypothetical protein
VAQHEGGRRWMLGLRRGAVEDLCWRSMWVN